MIAIQFAICKSDHFLVHTAFSKFFQICSETVSTLQSGIRKITKRCCTWEVQLLTCINDPSLISWTDQSIHQSPNEEDLVKYWNLQYLQSQSSLDSFLITLAISSIVEKVQAPHSQATAAVSNESSECNGHLWPKENKTSSMHCCFASNVVFSVQNPF